MRPRDTTTIVYYVFTKHTNTVRWTIRTGNLHSSCTHAHSPQPNTQSTHIYIPYFTEGGRGGDGRVSAGRLRVGGKARTNWRPECSQLIDRQYDSSATRRFSRCTRCKATHPLTCSHTPRYDKERVASKTDWARVPLNFCPPHRNFGTLFLACQRACAPDNGEQSHARWFAYRIASCLFVRSLDRKSAREHSHVCWRR